MLDHCFELLVFFFYCFEPAAFYYVGGGVSISITFVPAGLQLSPPNILIVRRDRKNCPCFVFVFIHTGMNNFNLNLHR